MAAAIKTIFISSTAIDLPLHRQQAIEACLRMGYFPVAMEHWPATDEDPLAVCLGKIDSSDIYLGIYAGRYGFIPRGYDKSVTELEFDRALAREIPKLIFISSERHPPLPADADPSFVAKLKAFKIRASDGRIRAKFSSPEDLRACIVEALAAFPRSSNAAAVHNSANIPAPPSPFIRGPYVLASSIDIIGRQDEAHALSTWADLSSTPSSPILALVAMGGTGKTALAWRWFDTQISDTSMRFSGRIWWSFYDNPRFDDFITEGWAYISQKSKNEAASLPIAEVYEQFIAQLETSRALIALDGFERLLSGYAASGGSSQSESALELDEADIGLRKAIDPMVTNFLRRMLDARGCRLLLTTRAFPSDIEDDTHKPRAGSTKLELRGLSERDAFALWRKLGLNATALGLGDFFRSIDGHALLIRTVAGEVANFRSAPGDFGKWHAAQNEIEGFPELGSAEIRKRIFGTTLESLDAMQGMVLQIFAIMRRPTDWNFLRTVLQNALGTSLNLQAVDRALAELEGRGLVGWNKIANRYSLHPLTRAEVLRLLNAKVKNRLLRAIGSVLDRKPLPDPGQANSWDDFELAADLFCNRVALDQFDDAFAIFRGNIERDAIYRLGYGRECAELLYLLFPNGIIEPPALSDARLQSGAMNAIAQCYQFCGQPGTALTIFERTAALIRTGRNQRDLAIVLYNGSWMARLAGHLRRSQEYSAESALLSKNLQDPIAEAIAIQETGLTLVVCGQLETARMALEASLRILRKAKNTVFQSAGCAGLAQLKLLKGSYPEAKKLAMEAERLAGSENEMYAVCAIRLRGEIALAEANQAEAKVLFRDVLIRARKINYVEEILPALVGLADCDRRDKKYDAALEHLEIVVEMASRGPFPLSGADAKNILAQIERDRGNQRAAVAAARSAYQFAQCGDSSFCYAAAIKVAMNHLKALGADGNG